MAYHPLKTTCSLGVLLLWMVGVAGCSPSAAPSQATQAVELDGRTFTLELALDDDARFQGLSDRDQIAPNGGMLFVFPDSAVRTFVMRRCLVPIDIVFLGANGRIVAMHAMTVETHPDRESTLTRYTSRYPAQFALELPGGTLAQLNLTLGQAVKLPLKTLKAQAR